MREIGTIISIEHDRAVVQVERGEQCNGCTACKAFGDGKMRIEALNRLDGRVGDVVEVMVEPRQVIKGSFLVFLLPLLLMVIGYFVGSAVSVHQETAGIVGSLAGLVLAFLLARWIDRRSALSPVNDAVIVEIIAATDA